MSGNMKVHFRTKNGKKRYHGYTIDEVTGYKQPVETAESSKDALASVFKGAKANGETLDGADSSIEAAIHDPLAFLDYLILDSDGAIAFDTDYARPKPDETQA